MISVSAPATLMICGEHAVVYGHQAIVCAVQPRLTVTIMPRKNKKVIIISDLGHHETDLDTLAAHPKLTFVLAALRELRPPSGLTLTVESKIDPTLGFGSSAAVTVASVAALARWRGDDDSPLALQQTAHRILLAVQQRGSGADLAAAISGGMIAYQPPPTLAFSRLPLPTQTLSVRYAGYKTPTATVLAMLAAKAAAQPAHYQQLYQEMGQCCAQAILAAQQQKWDKFYYALKTYQQLMTALGVCDQTQATHIRAAEKQAQVAKISGSGLGDCIFAFSDSLPVEHQAVTIDQQGLCYE